MNDAAISARNVAKSYMIARNAARHTTLGEALTHKLRHGFGGAAKEEFLALDDVSFEIKRGEITGVLGRNGAGKSTLLKILSRITGPSRGEVDIRGRVGSLLEVGTGFHPELTGRENIFLNGAILGMKRTEITAKFDEIVEFAEIGNFLDTPVKRYSSGMYVRLAFAVAAHLEPDILLVDEVLAVGDAQFQKKCLGKMGEISSGHGRTILFVSHNMAAMRTLCSRALLLDRGKLIADGSAGEVIDGYLEKFGGESAEIVWQGDAVPQSREFQFTFRRAWVENQRSAATASLAQDQPFTICVEYETGRHISGLRIGFYMENSQGTGICGSNDVGIPLASERVPGRYTSRCQFPGRVLNEGNYRVQFGADSYGDGAGEILCLLTPFSLNFTIEDLDGHQGGRQKLPGVVRPALEWSILPAEQGAQTQPASC